MSTSWKSQVAKGDYGIQFHTDDYEKFKIVERACCAAIDKVPSPWISVKERLPEKGALVLAWIKDENEPYPTVGSFDGDEREIGVWRRWVTHWMPLPDPPKKEV